MFKYADGCKERPNVTIVLNGEDILVPEGTTVASAMLAQPGHFPRVHPVTKKPREPYCLMGVCFECLVEIDGVKDRQACQTEVEDGMQVVTNQKRKGGTNET